jgi:hypothetical protein
VSQKKTVRAGIFRDAASARRAIDAAHAQGFDRVHILCNDARLRVELADEIEDDANLLAWSPGWLGGLFAFAGAAVGLVLGLAGAWYLTLRGIEPPIAGMIIPGAGVIAGAFVGAMASRGFTREEQDFFDQEVGDGEILVAIEARSDVRLAAAERILADAGVTPVALPAG